MIKLCRIPFHQTHGARYTRQISVHRGMLLSHASCEQGRAMERLAEDRKGPSCMEYKKRQMLAALETNVKVPDPSH